MQGKVTVLDGPDFILEIPNNSPGFPQPAIPTINVLAGQPALFSGNVSGFFGYTNPVTLTCQNGSPRTPESCPALTVFPNGAGAALPFTLGVSDSLPGTYTFDVVATGTEGKSHSQRVQINIRDLVIHQPPSSVINALAGFASPSMNFQIEAFGGLLGFVTLSCADLPLGSSCFIFPNSFNFFNGGPSSQSVALVLDSGSAPPGIYPVGFQALAFFDGTNATRVRPLTFRVLPADHFSITAPAAAVPNGPVNVTVKAVDHNEVPIANYQGTISFTSNDPEAVLPANYTFTGIGDDNGVHNFSVTFKKVGPRTITVTDVSPFALRATSGIVRVDTLNPNDAISLVSSRTGVAPPHFRDEGVTITAHVTALPGDTSPTGIVRFYEGLRELGATTLVPSGPGAASASLTLHALTVGNHLISAAYEGDTLFAPNLSLEISQTRSPAPRCQLDRCP